MTTREPTYAEVWADSINETYHTDELPMLPLMDDDETDDENVEATIRRVLMKAARILRGYDKTATFTGPELDIVRHLMPAHEVHQSGSVRFVLENYGNVEAEK